MAMLRILTDMSDMDMEMRNGSKACSEVELLVSLGISE